MRVDDELLDAAGPQLRIVANHAVGIDNVDLEAATRRGVIVANTPEVLTAATAEFTIALILSLLRRVSEGDRFLRGRRPWTWSPTFMLGAGLSGRTLGVVGLGRIGGEVARLATAFGMEVVYTSRSPKPCEYERLELEPLLQRADVVTLHCPLTDETRHLIGASALKTMRSSAYLVNTTRGAVVDEQALVAALRAGEIAGAALDVYEREPDVRPGARRARERCPRTAPRLGDGGHARGDGDALCRGAARGTARRQISCERAESRRAEGEPMTLAPAIAAAFQRRLGPDAVIAEPAELRTYECDGLTGYRVVPGLVVLPQNAGEVQATVRLCQEHRLPFVARGAGTGLSGGAVPEADGVVISLARMNRILEIDIESARVTVEPGVSNLAVTHAVAPYGYYYAPDPSSQQVCTIGGNVAENSGGAHCLKHGFTVNHVTALEVVLPDGEIVHLGAGKALDSPGPDLLGAFIGSEGTLGIATRVTVRILRRPEAIRTLLAGFSSMSEAGAAVSRVITAGILASAMEIMDRLTLEAAEQAVHPGYPDVGAILIVELDGSAVQVDEDLAAVEGICLAGGATEIRVAADEEERALFWKGRKAAFAAMGRVSPDYYVQDGVVPRTRLPEALERIAVLEREYGLRVGNVFHAGDGNLHPLVLYDRSVPGEPERAKELAEAILEICIDVGGSLTGEHGIGMDKACRMPLMFSELDLQGMQRLRRAFDPSGLCNPGKIFPTPRLCGEVPGPYRVHPLEVAGLADRF